MDGRLMKQGTEEWKQFRRSKICASDAPVIMGVSPWSSPLKLYEEKIFGFEIEDNPYMKRGRDLEPLALQAFEKQFNVELFPMVVCHPSISWMAASMDGLSLDKSIGLEIKCPGKRDHFMSMNGIIPEKYIPQLQHQMEVCGLDSINYYSFDGQSGVNLIVIRDQDYINQLLDKEFEFWQCLLNLKPPS
jgi:putative phage-type endonuclease